MDIRSAFGKRVRYLREKKHWSQEELAYRADVSNTYLSQLESGKREPCLGKMKGLSEAFGISLSQLVRGL